MRIHLVKSTVVSQAIDKSASSYIRCEPTKLSSEATPMPCNPYTFPLHCICTLFLPPASNISVASNSFRLLSFFYVMTSPTSIICAFQVFFALTSASSMSLGKTISSGVGE
jgi:hypothetical protein